MPGSKASPEMLELRKAALLEALQQARQRILQAAGRIPPAQQETPFVGAWSIRELLAHLAGWDDANREAIQALQEVRLPAFYAFHDRGWKSYNARLTAAYRQDDFEHLLESVRLTRQALLDALQAAPAAEFDLDRGVRFKGIKVTLRRLLEAETSDEEEHARQILAFLGEQRQ